MERFSTDDIPERDRLAVVNEVVARHIAGRRFEPARGTDLRVEIAAFGLPDEITVGAGRYSPIVGTRSGDLLGDQRDDYLLTVHTHDHEVSVDGSRPIAVRAGEIMLISDAVRSQFRLPDTLVKVVSFGRRRLRGLAPRIDLEAYHKIPATAAPAALLTGYADLLRATPPQGERARHMAAGHLYDLAALVLDGLVHGGTARSLSGIRAARLDMVRKDILDRLRDAELDIGGVARRQGVTPRYIQQLFAAEGTSFSDFVREARLDLALRMLEGGTASVAGLAFDCGFSDLSTFNRGFKRRFAVTPSDIRADCLRRSGT